MFNYSLPNPKPREKNNINFYFHTSLRYLKKFYEGLKNLIKLLRHHNEVWKQKFKLNFALIQFSKLNGEERLNDVHIVLTCYKAAWKKLDAGFSSNWNSLWHGEDKYSFEPSSRLSMSGRHIRSQESDIQWIGSKRTKWNRNPSKSIELLSPKSSCYFAVITFSFNWL